RASAYSFLTHASRTAVLVLCLNLGRTYTFHCGRKSRRTMPTPRVFPLFSSYLTAPLWPGHTSSHFVAIMTIGVEFSLLGVEKKIPLASYSLYRAKFSPRKFSIRFNDSNLTEPHARAAQQLRYMRRDISVRSRRKGPLEGLPAYLSIGGKIYDEQNVCIYCPGFLGCAL